MGRCQDKKRMREAIARMHKEKALKKEIEERQAKIKSGEVIKK